MIITLEGKNMKFCFFIDPVSAHIWGQGAPPFSQVWMVGLSPDAADVDHQQVWLRGKIQVGGWWNIETDANYFEADTCWCTRHFVLLVWNRSFTRDRRSADFRHRRPGIGFEKLAMHLSRNRIVWEPSLGTTWVWGSKRLLQYFLICNLIWLVFSWMCLNSSIIIICCSIIWNPKSWGYPKTSKSAWPLLSVVLQQPKQPWWLSGEPPWLKNPTSWIVLWWKSV